MVHDKIVHIFSIGVITITDGIPCAPVCGVCILLGPSSVCRGVGVVVFELACRCEYPVVTLPVLELPPRCLLVAVLLGVLKVPSWCHFGSVADLDPSAAAD